MLSSSLIDAGFGCFVLTFQGGYVGTRETAVQDVRTEKFGLSCRLPVGFGVRDTRFP